MHIKYYVRSAMLYGCETRALTETEMSAVNRAEVRMLRWMMGDFCRKLKEEYVRKATGVEEVVGVIRARRLTWFGHVSRMENDSWVKNA